jgi:transcriptional regulator GlxA family with amidase domain
MRTENIVQDDLAFDASVARLGGAISQRLWGHGILPGDQISLPVQIEGKLGRLVVSVDAFEEAPTVQRRRQTRGLTRLQLQRAYDAIRSAHAERLRLSKVAATVGLSTWQFSRSFQASAGMPFGTYLQRVRLDSAMRLMSESDRPLCDIALACGFGDQSHFSRSFSRTMGIAPRKWRRLQHSMRVSKPSS